MTKTTKIYIRKFELLPSGLSWVHRKIRIYMLVINVCYAQINCDNRRTMDYGGKRFATFGINAVQEKYVLSD